MEITYLNIESIIMSYFEDYSLYWSFLRNHNAVFEFFYKFSKVIASNKKDHKSLILKV